MEYTKIRCLETLAKVFGSLHFSLAFLGSLVSPPLYNSLFRSSLSSFIFFISFIPLPLSSRNFLIVRSCSPVVVSHYLIMCLKLSVFFWQILHILSLFSLQCCPLLISFPHLELSIIVLSFFFLFPLNVGIST